MLHDFNSLSQPILLPFYPFLSFMDPWVTRQGQDQTKWNHHLWCLVWLLYQSHTCVLLHFLRFCCGCFLPKHWILQADILELFQLLTCFIAFFYQLHNSSNWMQRVMNQVLDSWTKVLCNAALVTLLHIQYMTYLYCRPCNSLKPIAIP